MHDPETVAFEIPNPFRWQKCRFDGKWRMGRLATIWHVDPEKDGTDDSCGWFMRSRHGDSKVLDRIVNRFEFDWDRVYRGGNGHVYPCGWFKPDGQPHFSPIGVTVGLFHAAAGIIFDRTGEGFNWPAAERFVRRHLAQIILFAENPTDSLHDGLTRKFEVGCGEEYTADSRKERIRSIASCIYGWILREQRPWWRHPKWHIHHWRIQIHAVQAFKRWAFSRCAACGKRFPWGYAPVSDSWDGTGPRWFRSEEHVSHHECSNMKLASETGTASH